MDIQKTIAADYERDICDTEAAIRCFGPSACKEQISDTAQMILSISLTAVLIASFYTA